MSPETEYSLIDRLMALYEQGETELGEEAELDSSEYTDPLRAQRERTLFLSQPLVLGHSASVAPGEIWPVDIAGIPILAVRDREGTFRAFINACRHRGMKLAKHQGPCRMIVCPYHGWAYGLNGQLGSLPAFEQFPTLDRSETGLVELPVTEAGSLLWVSLTPGSHELELGDAAHFASEFGPWLEPLGVFRQSRTAHACNWKLPIDALLEGYRAQLPRAKRRWGHIGAVRLSDVEGQNVRIVSARGELRVDPEEEPLLRRFATVVWHLFPNTLLVCHEDSVSLVQSWPDGPARCIWSHQLLSGPGVEVLAARMWEDLEERTLQGEDLPMCEAIQSTLEAYPRQRHKLGQLEHLVTRWHEALSRSLER